MPSGLRVFFTMSADRVDVSQQSGSAVAVLMRDPEAPRKQAANSRRIDRLKDQVYREMLRLEANRPGSEMALALVLLRAAVQRGRSVAEDQEFQRWVNEVCSLGLKMIERSLNENRTCPHAE
jgi:hypothetical protein